MDFKDRAPETCLSVNGVNYDSNGIPDIYDTDDDNDGIPTSVELQYHLDPFNKADAPAYLDNDGLSNIFEYENGVSINDPDTAHDGINDGEELKYWNETRNLSLSTAIDYCTNPDVDGDNITDGKEIYGYEVKIIVDWKSDGTPISRMRYISPSELDPLTPYTNLTGVYLDTDEDGIPDVVESWFSNTSIVTNSKYRQQFIYKFGLALYNKYVWTINYFCTVYYKDLDEHHNRTSGWQNATQWLRDQFNPLIRDRTPPMITKFDLWWEVEFSVSLEPVKVYAHVHIVVRDVGGISYLYILDEDSGESITYTDAGSMLDINHKFKASILTATFGSVKISIVAEDYAGNYISVEKELKGAFEQLLDALPGVWAQFAAALQRAAQRVAQAVNIIGKWVEMVIEDMMNTILGELTNALNSYLVEIVNGASLLIDEYNKTGQIDEDTFKVMENALLPGWLVGLAIGGILMALMITLMSVTLGMSTLLSMAIGLVISLVVTEAFKITEKEGFLPSGIDENMGVKEIINFIGLYLGFIKRDVRVNDHYQEGIWSVFSLLFAWLSVQFGMNAFAMAEADGTGILSGTLAIAAGVLAFVVGLAALFALGFTHNWGVMTFLSLLALFFSIEGVVFSALSLRGAGGAVLVVGAIGAILGMIGIAFSLKGLGVI